ncbi:MAG: galactokinase [Saprospiraceae bacterium]|jgi:galactokinase
MKDKILGEYKKRFGNPQIYVKSPGRANIIGEHTDYNHGLVFPFAIEQCIGMIIGKNNLGKLRLIALDIEEEYIIDIANLSFAAESWTRYFINSLVALSYDQSIGIDVVFGGNLPQGGGVSSSSALTCGFLAGLNQLFEYNHSLDDLVNLASQAENGIGLNGGIMDQTAILKGEKGKALMIDFTDFSVKKYQVPLDNYMFYLFNSGQKHNLVDTEYNKRRATCDAAVVKVAKHNNIVKTLRDMTLSDVSQYLTDERSRKRCTHVIEENNRVIAAAQLMESGNVDGLGELLLASHNSLSKNYEVSTPEVDYLVDRSQKIDNILGSRIMGGGFGGCTINFVKGELVDIDLANLKVDYNSETGLDLEVYEVKASDGVVIEML